MPTASGHLSLRAPTDTLLGELSGLLSAGPPEPVILLRPLPPVASLQVDDVDLLLTPEKRDKVLLAALTAAADGRVCLSITQTSQFKVRLTLWTPEADNCIRIDLWSAFTQLPQSRGRSRMIPAERFLQLTGNRSSPLSSTIRLPATAEFCLFILHLAARRKDFTSPSVRNRLQQGADDLQDIFSRLTRDEHIRRPELHRDLTRLIRLADDVRFSHALSSSQLRLAEDILHRELATSAQQDAGPPDVHKPRRSLSSRLRRFWHQQTRTIAIVGSDGCGKSTVCNALRQAAGFRPATAKKLYRRSWTYQIAGGIIKILTGTDRGSLDDHIAPAITLRAGIALGCRQLLGAGCRLLELPGFDSDRPLLLDRSPASFLITRRKSPHPGLSILAAREELLLPPITTVLLALPFTTLTLRKQEITDPIGHQCYQQLLFEQALRQQPVDLHVLTPSATPEMAARCLVRMLDASPHHHATGHQLSAPQAAA